MSTIKDSATPRTAQPTGNRGRYLRGLALANRKHTDFGYMERASHLGGSVYAVPSCTREDIRYRVDVNAGLCECEDHRRGHTCKHLVAAMILASRRRAYLAGVSK